MKTKFDLGTILTESRMHAKHAMEGEAAAMEAGGGEELSPDDISAILEAVQASEGGAADAGGGEEADLSPEELQALLKEKVSALHNINVSSQLKEAHLLGAAIFDGYLARASQVELEAQKIAAVQNIADPDLEKIAEELGYNHGYELAMKLAEESIMEGEKVAAMQIEEAKLAAYERGHLDALEVLAAYAQA